MPDDEHPQDPATRTEGEGLTLDMPEGLGAFTKGQVLGKRYQILEMLGRGGMGEVWHAFDLELRVDVALKALRKDFFESERRRLRRGPLFEETTEAIQAGDQPYRGPSPSCTLSGAPDKKGLTA